MPPTVFFVIVLAGILLGFNLRLRRWGLGIALVSAAALYVFATPLASTLLLRALESRIPATSRGLAEAQAIVVLSGNIHHGNGADIPDSVGTLTLERLDRAAALYRENPLPILVSGGPVGDSPDSLAGLMAQTLTRDFAVPVAWREEMSQTTFENAQDCAALLRRENIHIIALVTQPWHMPRAEWAFAREGLDVIPEPTARTALKTLDATAFFPQSASLADSFYALHEMFGLIYYRWRFG